MKNGIQSRADVLRLTPEVKLREYWRVLSCHRWVVILVILLVLGAFIVYLRTATPIYQAGTTLIREQEISASTLFPGSGGLRALAGSSTGSIQRQQMLLKSQLIVDEIVRQMAAKGFPVAPSEVRRHISLNTKTSDGEILQVSATSDNPTKAMELASTTSDVYVSKMSELRSTNLDQAESFLSEQLEIIDSKLRQAEEQLNTFREREGIVGDYKKEGSSGLLGQLGDLYAELSQIQNDRELAQAKLIAARQLLNEKKEEVASLGNNRLASQIESLQSLITNWQVELVMLRQTLTDKSREVAELKKKIATAQTQLDLYFQELKQHGASIDPVSEWQSLVQESIQLDIQLRGLQQNENIVKARIAKFKADHPQLISKEVELTRLERTARIHEQTYMLLVDKHEETRLIKHMKTSGITVIERATVPISPIRPNKRSTIIWGVLIALVTSVGSAFFLEHLDNSLKMEKDVERYLDLSVVGTIPMIKREKIASKAIKDAGLMARKQQSPGQHAGDNAISEQVTDGSADGQLPARSKKRSKKHRKSLADLMSRAIINLDPKSPVVESYRALWTNIQFARVDGEVKTILVSSPGPGEGKTLTVANLAITMARMGVKTLLIDTDLRRPRLHNIFQQKKEPGLSDLLIGGNSGETTSIVDFVRATEIENLYFLPSGKRPPNPAELLSSDRKRQLVEQLKSEFEMILFDSPPIVPVTDATVLASEIADIVLLVVKSGGTKREIAQKAQELLEKVNANIFGVVLNTIDYAKSYGSYYYYYHYHYYYSHEEEEE